MIWSSEGRMEYLFFPFGNWRRRDYVYEVRTYISVYLYHRARSDIKRRRGGGGRKAKSDIFDEWGRWFGHLTCLLYYTYVVVTSRRS